jgi:hypothetical protein
MKLIEVFVPFKQRMADLEKAFSDDKYTLEQEIIDVLSMVKTQAIYMPGYSSSGEAKDLRKSFLIPKNEWPGKYTINGAMGQNRLPYRVEKYIEFQGRPDLILLTLRKVD